MTSITARMIRAMAATVRAGLAGREAENKGKTPFRREACDCRLMTTGFCHRCWRERKKGGLEPVFRHGQISARTISIWLAFTSGGWRKIVADGKV
jgi:hypothetical protein